MFKIITVITIKLSSLIKLELLMFAIRFINEFIFNF